MTGAIGNRYVGLHELDEMGFLLHLLRDGDTFVDVGATIGSYTVLASAVIVAQTISVEPVPFTFEVLARNIQLNRIGNKVDARNAGIAAREGELLFSSGLDTVNHVATECERGANLPSVRVPGMRPRNLVGDRKPILIKIDVEGFEGEVLASGDDRWRRDQLAAVTMELNGSGRRYGNEDIELDRTIRGFGFDRFSYDPLNRRLSPVGIEDKRAGNVVYVRDWERVSRRLAGARSFDILGTRF